MNKERPIRRIAGKEVVHNRWLNVYPFIPGSVKQWKDDMGTQLVMNGVKSKDPLIDVYDLGGTRGIKDVLPEFLLLPERGQYIMQDLFQFRYMHDVCETLYANGYEDRKNLFGIPYDFRLVLDADSRIVLFNRFKEYVEKSVATNEGRRCVVFAHSLGCVMFKWFLSSHVSDDWIANHIEELILVSPPFGGSIMALKTVMFGDFYVPKFHNLYKQELQLNTGIIMCLPNDVGFSPEAELMRIGGRSVRLEDIESNIDMISFKLWRDLYKRFQEEIMCALAHVRTTVYEGRGTLTPTWYGALNEDSYPCDEKTIDGDGIITPLCSSVYTKLFGDNVDIRTINAKHTNIITHKNVLRKILETALASP